MLLVVAVPLVVLGVHALTSHRDATSRAMSPVTGGARSAAGPSADASSDTRGPSSRPHAPAPHDVVALGDSVPSGHACDCRPFPQVYGTLLSKRSGARVTEDNRAVSGLDTGGLLSQLRDPSLRKAVRRADIVLVTIGANDFQDHHDQVVDGRCGTGSTDCVSDELHTMGERLASALATIRSLRAGRPTTVLVTGYWNVFQDGDVARRTFGESGLRASLRLTRRANAVIRSTTDDAGARYVDIFAPFERSGHDITSLLAADGDHPDAAGHDLIARALLRVGLPRMH
jgi:lysophospholipase L1-like esterase